LGADADERAGEDDAVITCERHPSAAGVFKVGPAWLCQSCVDRRLINGRRVVRPVSARARRARSAAAARRGPEVDAKAFKRAIEAAVRPGHDHALLNRVGAARPQTAAPTLLPVDPSAPRLPTGEPGAAVRLEQVAAAGVPESCLSCPRRVPLTEKTALSFGYCEGCESTLRLCPACGTHQPQKSWVVADTGRYPGVVTAGFVCAGCAPTDRDIEKAWPRFECTLTVDDIGRHLLIAELSKMPGAPTGVPSVPVSRLVEALRGGGDLVVDCSDISQDLRDDAQTILGNGANQIGQHGRAAADALYRAWADFCWESKERDLVPPRGLTEAEQSVLVHGERPA
jgi:hypothetical protein